MVPVPVFLPGSTDSEAVVVDIAAVVVVVVVVVVEERNPSAAAAYIPSVADTGTEASTTVVVESLRGWIVFGSRLGLAGCTLLRALRVRVEVGSLRGDFSGGRGERGRARTWEGGYTGVEGFSNSSFRGDVARLHPSRFDCKSVSVHSECMSSTRTHPQRAAAWQRGSSLFKIQLLSEDSQLRGTRLTYVTRCSLGQPIHRSHVRTLRSRIEDHLSPRLPRLPQRVDPTEQLFPTVLLKVAQSDPSFLDVLLRMLSRRYRADGGNGGLGLWGG
jgi:hypothetical protein